MAVKNVLDRELFKTDATNPARGTGITSGLVDDFENNLNTLRQLNLVPERKPFDAFGTYAPALMTFFGALGQPVQGAAGPVSAATQQIGQAAIASAPLFGQAAQAKAAFDAADPEAGLKQMALEMALKEKPGVKLQSFEPVYGKFGTGDGAVEGYGFAKVYDNGTITYEYAGENYTAFAGLAEPEKPKDEVYFTPQKVSIRKKAQFTPDGLQVSEPGEAFDVFLQAGNQGSFKLTGLDKKANFSFDEYEIYDPENNFQFVKNIKIQRKGSDTIEDAQQVFDKIRGTSLVTLTDGTRVQDQFTIVDDGEKKEVYAQKPYKIIIDGEEYDTTGRQEGDQTFVVDPRPGSETQGQFINTSKIDDLETFFESKTANFRSVEEELAIVKETEEIKKAAESTNEAYDKIIANGKAADTALANYDAALLVLDSATTGSFAPQRNALLRFFETFGLDETLPTMYKGLEAAFNNGKTVSTEVLDALSMQAFITNARQYDDRLNNTEVQKIAQADFNVILTKEGSRLLIEINKANDQIASDGAKIARRLETGTFGGVDSIIEQFGDELGEEVVAEIRKAANASKDGTLSKLEAVTIADEYVSKQLNEFGNSEAIKQKIDEVLKIDTPGGRNYFYGLGNKQMGQTGISINLGEAYEAGQIQFAGYSKNGVFEYDDKQTQTTGFDDKLPMYVLFFSDPNYMNGETQRVIMQFGQ